jgi:hypothetical protein
MDEKTLKDFKELVKKEEEQVSKSVNYEKHWKLNEYVDIAKPDYAATTAKVITDKEIFIYFDYPLNKPAKFNFTSDTGFTVSDLVNLVCDTYKKIYEEESATPVKPLGIMYNRSTTDGKYGIWGHYITDLLLTDLYYDTENKTVHLGISS